MLGRRHCPLRPASQSPPPFGRCTGENRADVPLRPLRPADPWPMPVGPLQGDLDKVLGFSPLPSKQQRGPQQAPRPGAHEVLERHLRLRGPHTHLYAATGPKVESDCAKTSGLVQQAASQARAPSPRQVMWPATGLDQQRHRWNRRQPHSWRWSTAFAASFSPRSWTRATPAGSAGARCSRPRTVRH